MKHLALLVFLLVALTLLSSAQDSSALKSCADASTIVDLGTPDPDPTSKKIFAPVIADSNRHNSGEHLVALGTFDPSTPAPNALTNARATCTYTHGSSIQQFCNVNCAVFNKAADTGNPLAGITKVDNGVLTGILPSTHAVAADFAPGIQPATNAGATCTAYLGGAAAQCNFLSGRI